MDEADFTEALAKNNPRRLFKWYAVAPGILSFLTRIPTKFFFKIFCRLKIEGEENIKSLPRGAIFAANHTSELDPILMTLIFPIWSHHLPLFFVSMEKSGYKNFGWKRFLYGGIFFKAWGAYPAKTGVHDYEASLSNHIQILKDGYNVCIFPEGERGQDGKIGEAKGGVSYLAEKVGCPIVPVAIMGALNLRLRDILLFKGEISIEIERPGYFHDLINSPHRNLADSDIYKITAQLVMDELVKITKRKNLF